MRNDFLIIKNMPKTIYPKAVRLRAKNLYIKDISISEIAKLMEIPLRTLERWKTNDKWVQARNDAYDISTKNN